MIRAILFDFYDTLARIEVGGIVAARQRLAEACAVDPNRFQLLWRQNQQARVLGTLGHLEDEIAAMLRELAVPHTEERVRELAAADRAAWISSVRLYPDTFPTLTALRARGFGLGLVSNCSSQGGDVLRAHTLDSFFGTMALSFELGVAKPDPAIFLAACDGLGIPPSACAFVADGANHELDAARALGMTAVLIEHDDQHRAAVRSETYDLRVTTLAELLTLPFAQSPQATSY